MKNILDSNEVIKNAEILDTKDDEFEALNTSEELKEEDELEVLDSNVYKISPKEWKGKTIDRITLDYTKVTGRTIALAEKQFMSNGFTTTNVLFQSMYFQQIIASKISGLELEFFLDKLKGNEVTEICAAIQVFLQTGE